VHRLAEKNEPCADQPQHAAESTQPNTQITNGPSKVGYALAGELPTADHAPKGA
jgi:hypothetical protein